MKSDWKSGGPRTSTAKWRGIRRGWCPGDEEIREELLAAVHCLNKKSAVGITTKALSSAIAAIHEVIDRPRVLNPQLARHIGNLRVQGNKIKN